MGKWDYNPTDSWSSHSLEDHNFFLVSGDRIIPIYKPFKPSKHGEKTTD